MAGVRKVSRQSRQNEQEGGVKMEYWRGIMNWPIEAEWKCEVCEQHAGLEWGFVHAECRCNHCHAVYMMRAKDETRTILTIPRMNMRQEWMQPILDGWAEHRRFIDDLIDEGLIAPVEAT